MNYSEVSATLRAILRRSSWRFDVDVLGREGPEGPLGHPSPQGTVGTGALHQEKRPMKVCFTTSDEAPAPPPGERGRVVLDGPASWASRAVPPQGTAGRGLSNPGPGPVRPETPYVKT